MEAFVTEIKILQLKELLVVWLTVSPKPSCPRLVAREPPENKTTPEHIFLGRALCRRSTSLETVTILSFEQFSDQELLRQISCQANKT